MDTALQHFTDHIRHAAAHHSPLRIRGGGSKDFYGETLVGEVLDTRAWRGIVSYEPSELVVTVRAGTSLAELEAVLAEKGQCLAFEPPRFFTPDGSGGTCGGMVAAGLNGPSRASVGGVRDYVLGVQLINGRGEHLTFGGQVMKNVAGYDVTRLMVGAMGTLGLLTELSLKVLPVAPMEATLVFELDQGGALAQLHRWGSQPLPLNASCWVQDDTAPGSPMLLFVRLRGAVAAVNSAIQKMTQDVPGKLMDNAQASPDWAACRDQQLPFFKAPTGSSNHIDPADPIVLWRLSVPQTTQALDLPWPQLVEWHGGQRWLWAPASAAGKLRQIARTAGGSASIFIANNPTNTWVKGRFDALDAGTAQIHHRLKMEFDPAGIFNRDRLYPNL